jgi:Asp-tRNA(Asn)/Glu-tRNA(Gln) amidotransferase A subunit family amidase
MATDSIAIHELTAANISEMVRSGTHSAERLAKAFLSYTHGLEDKIHAFAYLNDESVLIQANLLDQGRSRGGDLGSLAGVPIALKDAIDTFDMPTEYGSPSLSGRQPRWDAKVVQLLRQQGAIVFGKTTLPAFCLGQPAKTCNPHNLDHTPGGSSSGSAAAVAAGMVPVAIGTQTSGSVIRPASFCGVLGFKPSRGLISRTGLQPLSETLDQVGVFARDIEDLALVAQTLIAADPDDASTFGVLPKNLLDVCRQDPPFPPKFVFVRTPFWDQMSANAQEAFDALVQALGQHVEIFNLPEITTQAIENQRIVMYAEFAAAMDEHMQHSSGEVDDRTKALVERGRSITSLDYLKAKRAIEPIAAGFDEVFDRHDAIITPASLGPAPQGLDSTGDSVMNALWSYLGMPAISLPLLQSETGLPIGVQLVGARMDDARLLRSANWLLKNFDSITGE